MRILSRYGPTGAYPDLAVRLAASCERFGLPYDIREIRDEGSWARMCNRKPEWILGLLLNTREAVLWLDADAEIIQPPTLLFGPACDIAVYNFAADPENGQNVAYEPTKLVSGSGCLYLAYTAPALELLFRWITLARTLADSTSTDAVLDQVFNTCRPPLRVLWLPRSYNRMDSVWPDVEPVIDHHYRAGKLREAPCPTP